MKTHLLILIPVGWFFVNLSWAAPPFPVPAKGGLPACQAELAACEASAQKLPATGQTTCWDTTGAVIDCAGTTQDGDIQAGAALAYTDTGLTIVDDNTTLEWEKKDDSEGLHDKDNEPSYVYVFSTLLETLNNTCNGAGVSGCTATNQCGAGEVCGFAGHRDWRIPNVKELFGILNHENFEPAISSAFNNGACTEGCALPSCSCTSSTWYWTSSSDANNPQVGWIVSFKYGLVNFSLKPPLGGRSVRAVRGGL